MTAGRTNHRAFAAAPAPDSAPLGDDQGANRTNPPPPPPARFITRSDNPFAKRRLTCPMCDFVRLMDPGQYVCDACLTVQR